MQTLYQRFIALLLLSAWLGAAAPSGVALVAQNAEPDFAAVFDEHWERMRDEYPYFELYGVDWEAERADHRPKAVASENATEFAWEMARLLSALSDAHTDYMPPLDVIQGWSMPDFPTVLIERKPHVLEWGENHPPLGPERFRGDPHAYPEIVSVEGTSIGCATQLLAAGPVNTTCQVRMRWPDGTETNEVLQRPAVTNVPPPKNHFGEKWIVSGRVGSTGYLRVKTFSPELATLGTAGKMTPLLREHLQELGDTDGLILDLQGNRGGVVPASDPFLSHFLTKRSSYRWGNSGGKQRVLVPRSPRYAGAVVVLVDENSASGAEWSARILRDAGRATVVGGRTRGAEAAIHRSEGSDGSSLTYSAWPMVEPGVTPFQDKGVELDHALPLTLEAARAHGYEAALEQVRRARFARALEVLGAPAEDLDALLELADEADREEETVTRVR